MRFTLIFWLLLIELGTFFVTSEDIAVATIDLNQQGPPFEHFWRSTGFCPPDPKEYIPEFFTRNDVALNLALIGSLPYNGIGQVRIHWLYNLIISERHSEELKYNYTHIDNVLWFMKRYKLAPGFELMGYPTANTKDGSGASLFKSFDTSGWKNFTKALIHHFIDEFGIEEVSRWRFETWNEPDLRHYNVLNFTIIDYLQYVFGSAEGLREAFSTESNTRSPQLMGPAGLFRDIGHPFCWGLLQYCNEAIASCPIQYISFHRKGSGTAEGVLNATLELLGSLYEKLPNVKKLPIVNDEADIMRTWSESIEWRGDVRYAAMIVEVIFHYYKHLHLDRNLKIELMSNDNGFLNYHPYYFTQRTLFARFQMNNTNPPHDQFIKKPSYTVMGLLSQLGNEYLAANTSQTDSRLTILATRMARNNLLASVLLVYANSSLTEAETVKMVDVILRNVEDVETKVAVYMLDNVRTNPYRIWKEAGSPVFPSRELRQRMRDAEEPITINVPHFSGVDISIRLNLSLPSVTLIKLCSEQEEFPGIVTNLFIFNITWNEVLLTWSDIYLSTKCIRTFEVEIESKCDNSLEFRRINSRDTIFLSYHYAPLNELGDQGCEATRGRYRVRAVDFWNRPGNYSEVVVFPKTTPTTQEENQHLNNGL